MIVRRLSGISAQTSHNLPRRADGRPLPTGGPHQADHHHHETLLYGISNFRVYFGPFQGVKVHTIFGAGPAGRENVSLVAPGGGKRVAQGGGFLSVRELAQVTGVRRRGGEVA